jgi:hypothetical protein
MSKVQREATTRGERMHKENDKRKPQNHFSYMSLRIAFIGRTNFLCFPVATGRRL